ncbi:hypothetical protein B0J13DRAFT_637933 [Dactylonectria estremocensis]|uniref:Uncharacterized protein n=1 Tax=Dactylonectria estremocensis TaxID=1079267 RepID=A0A9P9ENM2_9HYPO|nr:hypothetical protein B0J13DRAFT_637933 [Dactylonectria estremocensis]
MAASRLNQLGSHIGASHRQSASGQASVPSDQTYEVNEEPIGTARKIRIITIGAGASGLNVVRTLRKRLTNYEHVVYEKNPEVGGTWYENRYPGCKCDIPSHNYQFSWKPNHEWRSFFSSAEEIEAYLCKLCDDEGMRRELKLEHQVIGAYWNEALGSWKVTIKDLKMTTTYDDHCDFLLDASGILNHWKWPDIPGLHDFTGTLVHSANWTQDFEWAGKKVAVIGNGSSGVQIVPVIQKDASQLVHFIREPTWIAPPRLTSLAMSKAGSVLEKIEYDEEGNFTSVQIGRFKEDPEFYMTFVKAVEEQVNNNFQIAMKDSDTHQYVTQMVAEYMKAALGDDEVLIKALVPSFPLGCRRLTPGVGYLESLTQPNVEVVSDSIVQITSNGLVTKSGRTIEVDAIICATGFNVSFCPRFPLVGRAGNLQDTWAKELPQAYMSCAVPNLPNYFVFLGPNAPIGHGSVFTITELLAKYIVEIIQKCQTEGIKAISPSRAAVQELSEHTQTFMPRTAWAGSCTSWFKNGTENGPVTALHPGSRIHFFHMLERFRGEDWEYVYASKGNRFSYLGNGFSTKELDGSDSTWYLNKNANN